MSKHEPARPTRIYTELPGGLRLVVTDDGSRTLFDPISGETFHSESGAAAEAKIVFVENSGLRSKLNHQASVQVLEIGFGTGLNFLMAAEATMGDFGRLEYTAVDCRCLSPTVFQQLQLESLCTRPEWVCTLAQIWERLSTHDSMEHVLRKESVEFNPHLELTLVIDDAIGFCDRLVQQSREFDIVFMDAFSPAAASELWKESFFKTLFSLIKPGGVLTTYCVKSEIQRRFKNVGFVVKKLPGPIGGKREVLTASKPM